MSTSEKLLKVLMERAGVKPSRKRPRDTDYNKPFDTSKCKPNTKTFHASSNTDSTSSEASTSKPEART